jgi:hypothetical protein
MCMHMHRWAQPMRAPLVAPQASGDADIDGQNPRSRAFFKRVSLHKWQILGLTEHDVLVFADADLELLPLAEHDPAWAAQLAARALRPV